MTTEFILGVGSNLGNPQENILKAKKMLEIYGVEGIKLSSFYITKPVDCVPNTPDFTNCVLVGFWKESPQELLQICQKIEIFLGRPQNHSSHEARIIDLDILVFGNLKLKTDVLEIPHPRMFEREFVMQPLLELKPNFLQKDS